MAKTVCSNQELLRTEPQHIREALTKCRYPTWALDRIKHRNLQQNKTNWQQNGTRYWYKCVKMDIDEEYIGEFSIILVKFSRNIQWYIHLFITTIPPQATPPPSTNSTFWARLCQDNKGIHLY